MFTTEQAVAVSLLGNEYLALASGYEGTVIDYDSGVRISGVRIVFESVDGSVR